MSKCRLDELILHCVVERSESRTSLRLVRSQTPCYCRLSSPPNNLGLSNVPASGKVSQDVVLKALRQDEFVKRHLRAGFFVGNWGTKYLHINISSRGEKDAVSIAGGEANRSGLWLQGQLSEKIHIRKPVGADHDSWPGIGNSEASGYFGVVKIERDDRHRSDCHDGTLWRTAYQMGAAFIGAVGPQPRWKGVVTDTAKCWARLPAFNFPDVETLCNCAPYCCPIVAIAPGGKPLESFVHPLRALYVVAETDHELGTNILNRAVYRVSVPDQRGGNPGSYTSMSNVHSAALVLCDRLLKSRRRISIVRSPKLEKRKLEALSCSTSKSTADADVDALHSKKSKIRDEGPSFGTFNSPIISSHEGRHDPMIVFHVRERELVSRSKEYLENRYKFFKIFRIYMGQRLLIFKLNDGISESAEGVHMTLVRDALLCKCLVNIYFIQSTYKLILREDGVPASDEAGLILPPPLAAILTEMENASFRLLCYPKTLSQVVAQNIPEQVHLHPKVFSHCAAIVKLQDVLLFGVSPRATNFKTGEGLKKFEMMMSVDQISKAYCKLWELECRALLKINPGTIALDVGASPGGSTKFLLDRGCRRIFAVDPHELHEKLRTSEKIFHSRHKFQAIGDHGNNQLLVDLHDEFGMDFAGVDVCVCSVYCSAVQSDLMLRRLAKFVRPGGTVIITVSRKNSNLQKCVELDKRELEARDMQQYASVKEIWLLSSKKHERIIVARRSTT